MYAAGLFDDKKWAAIVTEDQQADQTLYKWHTLAESEIHHYASEVLANAHSVMRQYRANLDVRNLSDLLRRAQSILRTSDLLRDWLELSVPGFGHPNYDRIMYFAFDGCTCILRGPNGQQVISQGDDPVEKRLGRVAMDDHEH